MDEQTIVCRKLQAGDLFTFVKIIKPYVNVSQLVKVANDKPKPTGDLVIDKKANDDYQALVGIQIFDMLGGALTEDLFRGWLASLGNMTLEEFDQGSLELPFEIMTQVAKENDLVNFFSKVLDMMKNSFGSKLTKSKNGIVGPTPM